MQEVPLEFKSYWRVEVGAPAPAMAPAMAPAPLAVVQDAVDQDEPVPDAEPVSAQREVVEPEPVGAGQAPSGRFGLFGRN